MHPPLHIHKHLHCKEVSAGPAIVFRKIMAVIVSSLKGYA